jgi:dihydroflavonol-4-reductase
VTGGSGFVGGALVRRLVDEGREVRALARSEAAGRRVIELGATPVRGDVSDIGSLAAAMRGCPTVFHVAGVSQLCIRDPRPMLETNVRGSGNVVAAAARARTGRLVYTSSAAAIGEREGTVGREDSPHRGWFLSNYERSKHLAERRVLELAETLDVDVVCVNPSSVQGPGRTEGSAKLLLRLANGRSPVVIETTFSIVDVDDCTEGHLLAEQRGVRGERYIVSGTALTVREAVALLRRIAGRPERVRFLPGWVAMAGASAIEGGARLLRRDALVCRDAVRTLLHGHRYDGSRATRELGLSYRPIEDTVERTLRWYADRGLIRPIPSPGSPR